MALPLILVAAKALSLAKQAGGVLSEWNQLEPARKLEVRDQASAVMSQLNELRRALGTKLFGDDQDELSWDEARSLALEPGPTFEMAKQVVELLVASREMAVDEIAAAVGAVSEEDSVFVGAIEIAEDDGYVAEISPGVLHVTDFADGELIDSDHVRYIESCIVEYLEEVGVAGRDELALAIGAPSAYAEEYQAALERALFAGSAEWLHHAMYGLPVARLATFEPPADSHSEGELEEPDARQVKQIIGDLKDSVMELRRAMERSSDGAALESRSQVPTTNTGDGRSDALETLRQLKDLHDAGVLTDAEFQEKKSVVLKAF